jgi:hypothetical protein
MMRAMRLAVLSLVFAVMVGCGGGYQLRGTVVDGSDPSVRMSLPAVMVVRADDPRLSSPGVASATVALTLDPQSMKPIEAGSTASGGDGRFALPVGHGAGFLEYQAQVLVRRAGHQTAIGTIPLPRGNQRLLVILPSGKDTWRKPVDFVDETFEMGRPYMEGGR